MDRDLQLAALNEIRQRIEVLEALLKELPELFETRFRERLQPLLDQQQRLLNDNDDLRRQVLLLRGTRSSRSPLRLLARPAPNPLSADADGLPTAGSAGPTRR